MAESRPGCHHEYAGAEMTTRDPSEGRRGKRLTLAVGYGLAPPCDVTLNLADKRAPAGTKRVPG